MNKKGQFEISFGMIFSIILIIAFLAFGVYAIIQFLNFQKSAQTAQFLNNFQSDVNDAWKSPQVNEVLTYVLPTNIIAVCFKDDQFTNLQFTSSNIVPGKMIDNIDIKNITKKENPYCIQAKNGKVSITLSKDYGNNLVEISR